MTEPSDTRSLRAHRRGGVCRCTSSSGWRSCREAPLLWQHLATPGSCAHLRSTTSTGNGITYGEGLFVAVAANEVMTSSDGVTWQSRELRRLESGQQSHMAAGSSSQLRTMAAHSR